MHFKPPSVPFRRAIRTESVLRRGCESLSVPNERITDECRRLARALVADGSRYSCAFSPRSFNKFSVLWIWQEQTFGPFDGRSITTLTYLPFVDRTKKRNEVKRNGATETLLRLLSVWMDRMKTIFYAKQPKRKTQEVNILRKGNIGSTEYFPLMVFMTFPSIKLMYDGNAKIIISFLLFTTDTNDAHTHTLPAF